MKTEMVSMINSSVIGGNLVQLDNKNRYHVTDKNGHKTVLTRDQFERNLQKNQDKIIRDEDFTFKKSMTPVQKTLLTLAGLGAAAGILFNYKKIFKYFKDLNVKEKFNDLRQSPSGQQIETKINEIINETKTSIQNPQKTAEKVGEAAKNLTEKGTTAVLNTIDKISKFINGFRK